MLEKVQVVDLIRGSSRDIVDVDNLSMELAIARELPDDAASVGWQCCHGLPPHCGRESESDASSREKN
jgi:hypothetical protein